MIHGIGVDIIHEKRLAGLRPEDPFLRKTFTEGEREAAAQAPVPLRWYAERFAAKEAVFKALQISGEGVRLNEIETLNDENGIPRVTLYGALRERAEQLGICRIHISLSNEDPISVAYAVCER